MAKENTIHVRVSEHTLAVLRSQAAAQHRTLTSLVNHVLADWATVVAPGHTDLMISPEAIDDAVEALDQFMRDKKA